MFTAMTPSFCSLTDTKQSLQYKIKTHLSGPPMPKFEANMNYIPQSPPSSTKQCNKSATVKFHMELLLTTTTRKQSRSGATPIYETFCFRTPIFLSARLDQVISTGKKESYTKQGLFRRENSFFVTSLVYRISPSSVKDYGHQADSRLLTSIPYRCHTSTFSLFAAL